MKDQDAHSPLALSTQTLLDAFHLVLDTAPMVLFAVDAEGRFCLSEGSALAQLGLKPGEVVGASAFDLYRDHAAVPFIRGALGGRPQDFEDQVDGRVFHTHLLPFKGPDGRGWALGVSRDITEQRSLENQLEQAEFTDPATGLVNRRALIRMLSTHLDKQQSALVLTLAIDDFQRLYGALEYQQTQQLILLVAQRLASLGDDANWVARTGSTEFTLVFPSGRGEQGARIAQRLRALLGEPFEIDGFGGLQLSVSVGYAVCDSPGGACCIGADDLLRNAEAARHASALAGGNQARQFDGRIADFATRGLAVENRIRQAIERAALDVHYQPVVDLKTGRTVAAEALVRWTDAELGVVSPGEFIPIVERANLIAPLGDLVIETALRDLARWTALGLPVQKIAINCSGQQLAALGFADRLNAARARHGIAAEQIDIELTEHVLVEPTATVSANLQALVQQGYGIAIDDFGTGYSALGYLSRFPLNIVKVDRSFVSQFQADPAALVLARTIVQMAAGLRMQTVAEGIETAEQLQSVIDLGCNYAQGFYYTPGLPTAEFVDWVEAQTARDLRGGHTTGDP